MSEERSYYEELEQYVIRINDDGYAHVACVACVACVKCDAEVTDADDGDGLDTLARLAMAHECEGKDE